jgi:hypothetical protein
MFVIRCVVFIVVSILSPMMHEEDTEDVKYGMVVSTGLFVGRRLRQKIVLDESPLSHCLVRSFIQSGQLVPFIPPITTTTMHASMLTIQRQSLLSGTDATKTPMTAQLSTTIDLPNMALPSRPFMPFRIMAQLTVVPLHDQTCALPEAVSIDFCQLLAYMTANALPQTLVFEGDAEADVAARSCVEASHRTELAKRQYALPPAPLNGTQYPQQHHHSQDTAQNNSCGDESSFSSAVSSCPSCDGFDLNSASIGASFVGSSFMSPPQQQQQSQYQPAVCMQPVMPMQPHMIGSHVFALVPPASSFSQGPYHNEEDEENEDEENEEEEEEEDGWETFIGRQMTLDDEPADSYVATRANDALCNHGRIVQGKYYDLVTGTFCTRCGNTDHTDAAMCLDRSMAVSQNPLLELCTELGCNCLKSHTVRQQQAAKHLKENSRWRLSSATMCWCVCPSTSHASQDGIPRTYPQGCCQRGHEWRACEHNPQVQKQRRAQQQAQQQQQQQQ